MRSFFLIFLFFQISPHAIGSNFGGGNSTTGDVYIFSIGINSYSGFELKNCVNDAESIIDKIKNDKIVRQNKVDHVKKLYEVHKDTIAAENYIRNELKHLPSYGSVYSFLLVEEDATLENIRTVFKSIIGDERIGENDIFIFSFAGISKEFHPNQTFLYPYGTDYGIESKSYSENLFSLQELAGFLEQIPCNKQLIISESGNGSQFSQDLALNLFETNPEMSKNLDRERIIVTTSSAGYDGFNCDGSSIPHGPLSFYLIQDSIFLLSIFRSPELFEYQLYKKELECPATYENYVKILSENEFKETYSFILNLNRSRYSEDTRGAKVMSTNSGENVKNRSGKNYALLIATNKYNKNQLTWNDLKNPINDAIGIAKILKGKYNTELDTLFNPDKNEVLKKILDLKSRLSEKDKFIVFIAGHGYYDQNLGDGFLAFYDSKTVEEDFGKDSYLQMATLNRILDGVKSKQVFAIFDVCYGASFELNNPDLPIESYSNATLDNGVETFLSEKNKYNSRIFLASGRSEVPDYWNNTLNHSPFASKLIKALEEEDQFISPGKMFSYLQGNATEPVLKKFGSHEPRGDFLLPVIAN